MRKITAIALIYVFAVPFFSYLDVLLFYRGVDFWFAFWRFLFYSVLEIAMFIGGIAFGYCIEKEEKYEAVH